MLLALYKQLIILLSERIYEPNLFSKIIIQTFIKSIQSDDIDVLCTH
jgi:hypothetical protein